ncbi:Hsp20/alpha crystallin family, partial [Musa troglodytarum]
GGGEGGGGGRQGSPDQRREEQGRGGEERQVAPRGAEQRQVPEEIQVARECQGGSGKGVHGERCPDRDDAQGGREEEAGDEVHRDLGLSS